MRPSPTTAHWSIRPIRHPSPGRLTGWSGYSPSARMVIVVIYLREGLIGVNAWRANPTQARRYWEEEDRA
jgi:hypothetical protein